ncbi:hypothetical protein F8M41_016786 [Gigaspora margarita]|uniref:Uncharacterized protein n=1 Tax=Gigaspora margarita TaxID=4874 RepID=A0A8H4EUG7_GIGMA|nr:hypothetical protein F8M41_016786 [Gigaspora margarita]
MFKGYLGPVNNDDSDGQFDPSGLCRQYGINLGRLYENWKKRVNESLRQINDNLCKNESEEAVTEKEETPQVNIVLKSKVEIEKDKCKAPNPNQKSANIDCYNRIWDDYQNED